MSSDAVSAALTGLKVRVELSEGMYHVYVKEGKDWKEVATAKKYKGMLSELKQLRSKK